MNKEELGKLYPIKIVPYDTSWSSIFEKEKEAIIKILGSKVVLRVEHIGSTAVPNLSAKPTIDLLVEISEDTGIKDLIISKMTNNHYIHMKEQDKHLMFVKGYTPTGLEQISFHIHIGTQAHDFLWDRICFRDFLRLNPTVANEYEQLKLNLAKIYKHDREAYTESKTEFISKITNVAKADLKKS
ncbi:GrpB family protein [Bacillus sp. HMF5848]|uniref:GrpB family protein n=1 Tax=Bacillus sp. HMF5848 TaxID=2495421 RepID=UPI000F768671|nr:GrpB family protein [Bacillus sp. HMF5848]RSK27653.1 GrpB family protein [Bacillus sp. HMF5848]